MHGPADISWRGFGLSPLDPLGIDTPALLVDLDILDRNIARIAATCRAHGVGWRPHIKGIKAPNIVARLLKAGAIGITCAKLGEAEVMADSGVDGILIANQIVGAIKIERLMALRRRCNVIVAVDDGDNIAALADAARAAALRLGVVIEVDIGIKRAGVRTPDEARALAEQVLAQPSLELLGVMGWEGHAAPIEDAEEKRAAVAAAVHQLVACAQACRALGAPCPIVSCGGTGTYWLSAAQPGVTEIQAGGGIFCDVHYREHYGVDHPFALTLVATVTSRPNPRRIICDAGKKSMSGDMALPLPLGVGDVTSVRLSAEHATIEIAHSDTRLRPGDRMQFVIGYSDTTVHLHDAIYATRNGRIESRWEIAGRGKTS